MQVNFKKIFPIKFYVNMLSIEKKIQKLEVGTLGTKTTTSFINFFPNNST